jgi:hypothetical protein
VFIPLTLLGPPPVPMRVVFRYDDVDPCAVHMVFDSGIWMVARDLLRGGLDRLTGEGDVRVWPTSGLTMFLQLRVPAGEALFELPKAELSTFLAGTESMVPYGYEYQASDIDTAVRNLITGDAA